MVSRPMIYPGKVITPTNTIYGKLRVDEYKDISDTELMVSIEISIQFEIDESQKYGGRATILCRKFNVDKNTGKIIMMDPITYYKKSGIGSTDFIFISTTPYPYLASMGKEFINEMLYNIASDYKGGDSINLDKYTIEFDYIVDQKILNRR